MNIAVVGASGLIGSKVVELLRSEGHDVVASSRSSGVDVLTGAGLADALAGADALVDVTNSPDFEPDADRWPRVASFVRRSRPMTSPRPLHAPPLPRRSTES